MAEIGKNIVAAGNNGTNEDHHRRYAVAAALEVIAGYAASGHPSINLDYEFGQLSSYADQIQKALKAK
ncbi:MAG TPA: hypothetical protein K8W20_03015 [Pseudomonas lactis]|uniref:Uncharacterized protein n=1 Tax=Pseudomonas lactis TaxID=1615674 RepID=A0A921T625_9PSED|nr:hypothetical protein [Pseudomonas lactis]HJH17671.1 hypothetical protein [Pseudomonas lactis]